MSLKEWRALKRWQPGEIDRSLMMVVSRKEASGGDA
jgi:hypothetical protein